MTPEPEFITTRIGPDTAGSTGPSRFGAGDIGHSLVIGIHHGQTMQKMAEENARLVQANSWPLLQFITGNTNDKGEPEIKLKVENAGVRVRRS